MQQKCEFSSSKSNVPECKLSSYVLSALEHGLRSGWTCGLEYKLHVSKEMLQTANYEQTANYWVVGSTIPRHMILNTSSLLASQLWTTVSVGTRCMHLSMFSLEVLHVFQSAKSFVAAKRSRGAGSTLVRSMPQKASSIVAGRMLHRVIWVVSECMLQTLS